MAPTSKTTAKTMDQAPKQKKPSELDETLTYICHDILGIKPDSPITLALREAEILNIQLLNQLTEDEINELSYTQEGSAIPRPLLLGQRVPLKSLVKWCKHLLGEKGVTYLTDEQWKETSAVDYKLFTATLGISQITVMTPPTTNDQQFNNHRVIDKVAEFKKGTKRGAALYPTLNDNRHWNNWNRSVLAQAHSHDLKAQGGF